MRRRALEVISMSTLFHTTSNQFTPLDTLIESITSSVGIVGVEFLVYAEVVL